MIIDGIHSAPALNLIILLFIVKLLLPNEVGCFFIDERQKLSSPNVDEGGQANM